jgi:hypothetical protein
MQIVGTPKMTICQNSPKLACICKQVYNCYAKPQKVPSFLPDKPQVQQFALFLLGLGVIYETNLLKMVHCALPDTKSWRPNGPIPRQGHLDKRKFQGGRTSHIKNQQKASLTSTALHIYLYIDIDICFERLLACLNDNRQACTLRA